MTAVDQARPFSWGRPTAIKDPLKPGTRVCSLIDSGRFGVDLRAGDFGTVVDQPTAELVFVRFDGFEMCGWMRRDHLEVIA